MNRPLKISLLLVLVLGGFSAWTARLVGRAERAYPPTGHFLRKDSNTLHFLRAGQGPPVLLLHGDGGLTGHELQFNRPTVIFAALDSLGLRRATPAEQP